MQSTQAAKKQKTTIAVDLEWLKTLWSPGRDERSNKGDIKVRSASHGSLRGGDWVLNEKGQGATLSFCFLYNKKFYGLTVGHLAASVGESVFRFSDSEKLPIPIPEGGSDDKKDDDDREEIYMMFKIGRVVSMSKSTDSLIFELNDDVPLSPPKTVTLEPNSSIIIELPKGVNHNMPPPPPLKGTDLIGFGASRRGCHGVVDVPSMTVAHEVSSIGNIRISSPDGPNTRLTYPGDCGTIFSDLECNAIYFHHCGTEDAPWKSYGFPLWEVMSKHDHLGGTSENIEEQDEDNIESQTKELAEVASPGPRELAQFRTKIVAASPQPVEKTPLYNFGRVKIVEEQKKYNA